MKRVIITNKQLNEIIQESENVSIVNAVAPNNNLKGAFTGDTPTNVQNAATLGTDVDVRVTPQSGPGDTTIMLDNPQQTLPGATDAINKNPEAQTAISKGYNVQIPVKSTNERKSYSKRQIEEARLEKIRKEGSVMTKKQLKEEWEEKPINKNEIDWSQRKQMRMDNFWDTLEYYIGLKDEQGGLNPEQLADAKNVCDKLSCFGADAEEFCDYAREVLGLGEIQENKIEIKPENKGKFNATKKRTGKSTEELTHSKNPLTRKRAVFAQNAKRWNKK